MPEKESEKEFEKNIREHELLIHKICRLYAYTDADRQDLFREIVIHLWKTGAIDPFIRIVVYASVSTALFFLSLLFKKKDVDQHIARLKNLLHELN